jgi:hypothetical protein
MAGLMEYKLVSQHYDSGGNKASPEPPVVSCGGKIGDSEQT